MTPPLGRPAGSDVASSAPRRDRARRRWAVVALTAAALAPAGCGGSDDGTSNGSDDVVDQGYQSGDGSVTTWPPDERGDPVELSGTDFAGAAQDVALWRGDVVVLNTWYAACPPCRKEAPDLVAVAVDYADKGVHVLGINGVDDAGAAEAFQRTFDVPYPSIQDTDKQAVAALQGVVPVQATPTTVVLDRSGRVAARVVGTVDGSTLRALVDEVLAQDGTSAGPSDLPSEAS